MLSSRVFDIRERIFCPFLYLLIHDPSPNTLPLAVTSFALKHMETCCKFAPRFAIRHRHHGTLYAARVMFGMSLMLVAAVKSGRMEVPKQWREAVQISIAMLRYWELESPDLGEARIILQNFAQGLDTEGNHADFSEDNSGDQSDDDADTHISA
jgi:hypothetical protein